MFEEHRAAFEYDWRNRFNLPLSSVPDQMSWGEAWRVFGLLLADPSSHGGTAVAGWEYPVTRADLAARDLYDLTHQIAWLQGGKKGSKPKPYPRPWPERITKTLKPDADLTQDQIVAALRYAGHTARLPTR